MHFRRKNINIASANILLVQSALSAFGLFLASQVHQSIARHLSMRLVKNNVLFSDPKISEELSDLLDSHVERQTSDLYMLILVFFCKVVWKSNKTLSFLRLDFWLLSILVIFRLLTCKLFSRHIQAWPATPLSSWIIATSAPPLSIIFIALFVRLEVILSRSAATTPLASSTSPRLKITSAASLKSVSLFNLKVLILLVRNKGELNKASANVILLSVVVGELGILCVLKLHNSLSCNFAGWVLSNFNGFFDQAEAMEELFNVVSDYTVR